MKNTFAHAWALIKAQALQNVSSHLQGHSITKKLFGTIYINATEVALVAEVREKHLDAWMWYK
jgi:hypothetical protein